MFKSWIVVHSNGEDKQLEKFPKIFSFSKKKKKKREKTKAIKFDTRAAARKSWSFISSQQKKKRKIAFIQQAMTCWISPPAPPYNLREKIKK